MDIYLLKVNNRNTRKRCEICSGVFIVNFEHILHLVLVFLLLTLNMQLPTGKIHVNNKQKRHSGTGTVVLVIFTDKNFNRKLHFLCSDISELAIPFYAYQYS